MDFSKKTELNRVPWHNVAQWQKNCKILPQLGTKGIYNFPQSAFLSLYHPKKTDGKLASEFTYRPFLHGRWQRVWYSYLYMYLSMADLHSFHFSTKKGGGENLFVTKSWILPATLPAVVVVGGGGRSWDTWIMTVRERRSPSSTFHSSLATSGGEKISRYP